MDGTLITGHVSISKKTQEAIRFAQSKGIKFIAATGRNYQEAITPLQKAGLATDVIGVNGAAVYSHDGKIIETNPIAHETLIRLMNLLDEHHIYYEVVEKKTVYIEDQAKRLEYFAAHIAHTIPHLTFKQALTLAATRMSFFPVTTVPNLREVVKQEGFTSLKVFSIAIDPKSFIPVKEAIAKDFPDLAVSSSDTHNMEITDINGQKGIAVKNYAQKLGIDASEVMAIGDSYNDLSMLEYAGVSFAMGNADDFIKSKAKYVTTTNEEDGVALAIMRAIEENL
jgi:Cof subfamily protein (haloacid dehalogenase superfamily)